MNKSIKIGYVRIRPRGPGAWQADWRDAASGLRQRRTIRATTEADARRQARALSDAVASGKWHGPNRNDGPTVTEALKVAIESSSGNSETHRWYVGFANEFLKWLAAAAPTVRLWSEVGTETMRRYLNHLQHERELSDGTIRARLLPLRMASRYWHESDPTQFRDAARPVRVKARPCNPIEAQKREARKGLSATDVRAFLGFLKAQRPSLHGPVMLQALAGLRVREALALRECDVDLAAATVTVTQTATHTPKNQTSYRSIPVAPMVLDVLRETIMALPVGDPQRPVFVTQRFGAPWRNDLTYGNQVRKAMRASGIPALGKGFAPRMFRAAFVVGVRTCGADAELVKGYVGHARDMLGTHYDVATPERLREVVAALEKWCHKSVTRENRESVSSTESTL